MSEYMIDLCETMENMFDADFDSLMHAMLYSDVLTAGEFPNPNKKRDMHKLYRRLQPYMDK